MLNLQHNVVNILYSIKGMIDVYLDRGDDENHLKRKDESSRQAESVLRRIYERVDQALAITKRISLAMKAEKDPQEIESEVSVKKVWEDTTEILKRQHSFEKFEMFEVIDHIPDGYPPVKCSRNDLLEIFYTLAQNAVQAMMENGKLIVRANLQLSPEGNTIAIITVSDTGPGIPEEILSRLFEPFFTTKSMSEGNGLGLCLVKSLVKKNGGCVNVSSFKGCGTTFTLSFPVARLGDTKERTTLAMTA